MQRQDNLRTHGNPIIEIRGAAYSYGGPMVFEALDLNVYPGEILCLMGNNGCGKTTLIDSILGFHEISRGTIRISGQEAEGMKPQELARQIAYVPQIHDRSFPYMVKDVVLMGRTAHKGTLSSPGEEDRSICEEAMRICGIDHLADRPYTRISGGELQMVMLARAIVQEAPLIIMDEPASHLDFRNEMLFLEMVVRLVREKSVGVLLATHSPNQAFYFENAGVPVRVALMAEQRIRSLGRPSEILDEESLRQAYHMDVRVADVDLGEDGIHRQIIPVRTRKQEEENPQEEAGRRKQTAEEQVVQEQTTERRKD